ncbi:MAG: phasin family protein [Chromatiales bacterium]|nr:phasin family protein [Chromatiales bacterium]
MMDAQIQNFVDNVVVRAKDLTGGTVTEVRNATKDVAGKVKGAKGTVHEIGQRGLKLNEIAFRYMEKLIKLQLKFVEGSFDEGAKRLSTAANAPSFRKLVKDQVTLLPMTRDRIARNAKETIGLVKETRDGVVSLFQPAAAKPKRAKKATASKAVAKKAVRKAPAKKAAVRKASAKKSVAKKPAVKKAVAAKAA